MTENIFTKLNLYIHLSFLRRLLDSNLKVNSKYFKGDVLDVGGGRVRGEFDRPNVKKWVILDINRDLKPDIIGDIQDLPFKNSSFNTVKATEILEHVRNPEKAISEVARVLKKGGVAILSIPFMYPVHADPEDYQRLTDTKIKTLLKDNMLDIIIFKVEGYFFVVWADMMKSLINTWPLLFRWLGYLLILPMLELTFFFDNVFAKKSKVLSKYHGGYFIIAKKQ